MKYKLLSLGLFLLAASSSAMAVDGYRGVKFGSSFNELNAAKLCKWKKHNGDFKEMDSYYCEDFKFSGESSLALAFFINGKFERFAITIDQDITPVIAGLKKKYGELSTAVTPDDLAYVKMHGGHLNVNFDNGTVILLVSRDKSTKEDTTQLIYTSPEFEALYNKLQENKLGNDI